jgi:hypothetical protein
MRCLYIVSKELQRRRFRSARTLRADGGWRRYLCRSPLRMNEHHFASHSAISPPRPIDVELGTYGTGHR